MLFYLRSRINTKNPGWTTFLSGVFSPLTSAEACEKSIRWVWREKLCYYWCEKARKHRCVTDRHDMTSAVKVALNSIQPNNTINGSNSSTGTILSDSNIVNVTAPLIQGTNGDTESVGKISVLFFFFFAKKSPLNRIPSSKQYSQWEIKVLFEKEISYY